MVKKFVLEDLDCANCAAKIEKGISELSGVNSVKVTFMTQKMVLDCEDDKFDEIVKGMKKVIKKYEPDVELKSC